MQEGQVHDDLPEGPVTVLIVDDEPAARAAMKRFLQRKDFLVEAAETGEQALKIVTQRPFDVVVADVVMPGISGLELLAALKEVRPCLEVILVSAYATVDMVISGLRAGAADFLVKPLTAERLCGAVLQAARTKVLRETNHRYRESLEKLLLSRTQELRESEAAFTTIMGETDDAILMLSEDRRILFANGPAREIIGNTQTYELPLPVTADGQTIKWFSFASPSGETRHIEIRACPITWLKKKVLLVLIKDITSLKRAAEEQRSLLSRLLRALETTAEALAGAVEMRDPYTSGHQKRVATLACAIHEEMGLSREAINGVRIAGMLHDLGKLQVPTEILVKPTRLTDLEFRILQQHARAGYDILKNVDFPWPIAMAVLQHHERLDGSGYPDGLKGNEIIIEARILGVADVVEAMASHRPYRPALGIEAALDEIQKKAGVLYDPDVVQACVAVFSKLGSPW